MRSNPIRHYRLHPDNYYVNAGGGIYMCIREIEPDKYLMVNASSGWRFIAHVITLYSDGSIEWDYSTEGSFYE